MLHTHTHEIREFALECEVETFLLISLWLSCATHLSFELLTLNLSSSKNLKKSDVNLFWPTAHTYAVRTTTIDVGVYRNDQNDILLILTWWREIATLSPPVYTRTRFFVQVWHSNDLYYTEHFHIILLHYTIYISSFFITKNKKKKQSDGFQLSLTTNSSIIIGHFFLLFFLLFSALLLLLHRVLWLWFPLFLFILLFAFSLFSLYVFTMLLWWDVVVWRRVLFPYFQRVDSFVLVFD